MGKLFQIEESDLQALEELIPPLCDRVQSLDFSAHGKANQAEIRTKARRLQTILTNIRWNYGPPEIVEQIPAGDDPPQIPPNEFS